MSVENVDLIRAHFLKYYAGSLRVFVSSCPGLRDNAHVLEKFYGVQGQETAAVIADFLMVQLRPRPTDLLPPIPDDASSPQGDPQAGGARDAAAKRKRG